MLVILNKCASSDGDLTLDSLEVQQNVSMSETKLISARLQELIIQLQDEQK
jgi:hypothetical protein